MYVAEQLQGTNLSEETYAERMRGISENFRKLSEVQLAKYEANALKAFQEMQQLQQQPLPPKKAVERDNERQPRLLSRSARRRAKNEALVGIICKPRE